MAKGRDGTLLKDQGVIGRSLGQVLRYFAAPVEPKARKQDRLDNNPRLRKQDRGKSTNPKGY